MLGASGLALAATDALFELLTDLRTRGIELRLAHARAGVRDRMRQTGFLAELGEGQLFMSTQQAVDAPLPAPGGPGSAQPHGGSPPAPDQDPAPSLDADASEILEPRDPT